MFSVCKCSECTRFGVIVFVVLSVMRHKIGLDRCFYFLLPPSLVSLVILLSFLVS